MKGDEYHCDAQPLSFPSTSLPNSTDKITLTTFRWSSRKTRSRRGLTCGGSLLSVVLSILHFFLYLSPRQCTQSHLGVLWLITSHRIHATGCHCRWVICSIKSNRQHPSSSRLWLRRLSARIIARFPFSLRWSSQFNYWPTSLPEYHNNPSSWTCGLVELALHYVGYVVLELTMTLFHFHLNSCLRYHGHFFNFRGFSAGMIRVLYAVSDVTPLALTA